MFRRNIDFLAVFIIAAAMMGFSKVAPLRLPEVMDSIQTQNAVSADLCPIQREVLSRIAYILNQ
jgi:uncharacterized membrane protein